MENTDKTTVRPKIVRYAFWAMTYLAFFILFCFMALALFGDKDTLVQLIALSGLIFTPLTTYATMVYRKYADKRSEDKRIENEN